MLYKITCGIVHRLFCRMKRHAIFRSLIENKQIILVHKGGIAQRLVLLSQYPQHRAIIEEAFGLGGDNDCNLFIDPHLENYEYIHHQVVEYVWHFLLDNVDGFSCGSVNKYAHECTSIEVLGQQFPVMCADRNHFSIEGPSDDCDTDHMGVRANKQSVFTTRNDTLKFEDEVQRLCKFSLLRY